MTLLNEPVCASVCHCLLSIKLSKWISWIDILLHFSGLLEILSCHLAVEYVWKGVICMSFPDSTINLEISPPIQPNVLEREHWCLRVSSKCSQMMKHLFNWMLVNENAGFWDAIISPSPISHCLQLEATHMEEEETVTVIFSLGSTVPCGCSLCLIQDAESIVRFHNKVLNLS